DPSGDCDEAHRTHAVAETDLVRVLQLPALWHCAALRILSNAMYRVSVEPRYIALPRSQAETGNCRSGSLIAGLGNGPGNLVLVLVLVVEPGQPGSQPLDRGLELGIEIDELAQQLGDPGERDPLLAAPFIELFDAAVGEVHPTLHSSSEPLLRACSLILGSVLRRKDDAAPSGHRTGPRCDRLRPLVSRRRPLRPPDAARPHAAWPNRPRARTTPDARHRSARGPARPAGSAR